MDFWNGRDEDWLAEKKVLVEQAVDITPKEILNAYLAIEIPTKLYNRGLLVRTTDEKGVKVCRKSDYSVLFDVLVIISSNTRLNIPFLSRFPFNLELHRSCVLEGQSEGLTLLEFWADYPKKPRGVPCSFYVCLVENKNLAGWVKERSQVNKTRTYTAAIREWYANL